MAAMTGMPPPTAASKAIVRPTLRGTIEQLAAMFGQQGLIGRDHVLAALQHLEHDRAVGLQAADELHDRLDFRVVQTVDKSVRQQAGRRHDIARTAMSASTIRTNSTFRPA